MRTPGLRKPVALLTEAEKTRAGARRKKRLIVRPRQEGMTSAPPIRRPPPLEGSRGARYREVTPDLSSAERSVGLLLLITGTC